MYRGLHAPNRRFAVVHEGRLWANAKFVSVMTASKTEAVKLLHIEGCEHGMAEYVTVRERGVPAAGIVLRLPNSRVTNGPFKAWPQYAAEMAALINAWYPYGLRVFQVDNEPNVEGMWDHLGFGPAEYQWFMRRVVKDLKTLVPRDVVLVSPPLSYAPALWNRGPENHTAFVLNDWLAAYSWNEGGLRNSLFDIFDKYGTNPYWQNERQMRDPSYGRLYEAFHALGKGQRQTIALEFGNSGHQAYWGNGQRKYTDEEVEQARIAQYPRWLKEAEESGIMDSAFTYIAPDSTDDWNGFEVSEAQARAMAR